MGGADGSIRWVEMHDEGMDGWVGGWIHVNERADGWGEEVWRDDEANRWVGGWVHGDERADGKVW